MTSGNRLVQPSSPGWTRPILYILCFIAAAAALRRIVALLLVGASSRAGHYADLDRTFADHKSLTLAQARSPSVESSASGQKANGVPASSASRRSICRRSRRWRDFSAR